MANTDFKLHEFFSIEDNYHTKIYLIYKNELYLIFSGFIPKEVNDYSINFLNNYCKWTLHLEALPVEARLNHKFFGGTLSFSRQDWVIYCKTISHLLQRLTLDKASISSLAVSKYSEMSFSDLEVIMEPSKHEEEMTFKGILRQELAKRLVNFESIFTSLIAYLDLTYGIKLVEK